MTTDKKLLDHVIAPAPRYILRLALLETIFEQYLPAKAFSSIEFGPGLGDVAHYLAHSTSCDKLTLVDFSKETLEILRERFRNSMITDYVCDELGNISSETTFDLVLAFEVLEHIDDDIQAIEKLFSLTKPGGRFIMSVPAYQKKWQKQDVYAGHLRRYERADLASKLESAGFADIRIIDYGFPLTALMYPFRQTLYKPDDKSSLQERTKKSGINRPFFARLPLSLLYPMYFPFIKLQKLFINKDLGDGFIATAKKAEIAVISVGNFTEAYPNTFFKHHLLMDHYKSNALSLVFDLSDSSAASGLKNLKVALILKFIVNNIRALLAVLTNRPKKIYVCYPGVMLAFLYKLLPRKHRPLLYLDAFISIYDTAIIDRKLISKESAIAKLLLRLEKMAYSSCEMVLVDTSENANYMASLFGIPMQNVRAINLTIPELSTSKEVSVDEKYTCLFIGTFVPLQGIECIAQAANILAHRRDIQFVIIGNGQDGSILRAAIEKNAAPNILWREDWHSTAQLTEAIASADICLGIFGTTEKTERVWPFKNYLYMAAGKPLITGDSICARELARLTDADAFVTSTLGSASALANSITTLLGSVQLQASLGSNARSFYEAHLSHEVAERELIKLLDART